MHSDKCILFVYGRGGHTAQMNRFVPLLSEYLGEFSFVSLSDNKAKPEWSCHHYTTNELRRKYGGLLNGLVNMKVLSILMEANSVNHNHNIEAVVSTGPGVSVLAALYFKIRGVKIIHIETWSRFSSRSMTGRVMSLLADRFYVQNESLVKLYPKSIYSGLL